VLLPDAGAFRPDPTTFGEPPVDVSALYVPTVEYVVTSLDQDSRIRPRDGRMIPTVVVSFTVPGLPGNFTIAIDNYAFTHADVLEYMRERSYVIRSLYALPDKLPPYDEAAALTPQAGTTLEAAALLAAQQAVP
jgi:hypothetical protein